MFAVCCAPCVVVGVSCGVCFCCLSFVVVCLIVSDRRLLCGVRCMMIGLRCLSFVV